MPTESLPRLIAKELCNQRPNDSIRELARLLSAELKIGIEAARSLIRRVKSKFDTPAPQNSSDKLRRKESSDVCDLEYIGDKIRTVDELLKHAEVDLSVWRVDSCDVNAWEVAGKKSLGQNANGRWLGDKLWQTSNLQIKVRLKRIIPKPIEASIDAFFKRFQATRTFSKVRQAPHRNSCLLDIEINDQHWGKRAWGKETGNNYDLEISDREFRVALDGLLVDATASGRKFDKIVLPIGNDFFHANNFESETSNKTRVESVDSRMSLVFSSGVDAILYAVNRCLTVAPVQIVFVPGNHDRHTGWYLSECVRYALEYNHVKHATVDNDAREHKYVLYGNSLLGFVHGDEIKHDTLPQIMAGEVPGLWSQSKFRRWNLGHWHHRRETRYIAADTLQGVEIRLHSSLCGTDAWHYRKGFTGSPRMAAAVVWSKDNGPVAEFYRHATETAIQHPADLDTFAFPRTRRKVPSSLSTSA